jgi:glycerate-2-kinase
MKADLLKLFRTAIAAVDPYLCVKEHLLCTSVSNHTPNQLRIGDTPVSLNRNLYVAAFGKAALSKETP